jgi:hypothetical protein
MHKFEKYHPGEVVWYMHTDPFSEKGLNLDMMRRDLGMTNWTFFPSRVEMQTGIDRDAMSKMYNALDVFLLPSKGEGFGIPYIESQACGVPVIMTKCTGHEELLGGGWYLKNLEPMWTPQSSWQYECDVDEIVETLELAYKAKKDGSIEEHQKNAIAKAAEYDDEKVYSEIWPVVLEDIEKRIHEPKNMEGVQPWRLAFIPQTCIPRKVIDLGAGLTTPYKKHLEHLGDYVAVDKRAEKDSGIVNADATNLYMFKDREFGFVWCSEMLEHVDDPRKALREMKRVAVHGCVLFSTPANPSFKLDPEHRAVDMDYHTMATGDGMISW